LAALLGGCGSNQIPLDAAEQQWTAQASHTLGATVSLQHDRATFLAGRGRATLSVVVTDTGVGTCQLDTVRLKQLALRLATEAHAVVRYNCLYDTVGVYFLATRRDGPRSESGICARDVRVALQPRPQARLVSTWMR
jgi:hypothetical protein